MRIGFVTVPMTQGVQTLHEQVVIENGKLVRARFMFAHIVRCGGVLFEKYIRVN